MKKLTLLALIVIATCTAVIAQPRAIGGRIGWNIGASYQHQIGEKNMIQADLDLLGYWYGGQATVTYNWIIPIKSWEIGTFNAFAGVGVGGGFRWGYRSFFIPWRYGYWGSKYGFVGVAGNGGVEFNFKFGLQLSAEWRPLIGPRFYKGGGVGYYLDGLYVSALALGVRYRFGK